MHARHSRRADPPCAALPALQVVMQYSGKSVHTSWKMKGDLIYFPHDGPKEIHTKLTDTESWKAWLTERVAQTRDCDFRLRTSRQMHAESARLAERDDAQRQRNHFC